MTEQDIDRFLDTEKRVKIWPKKHKDKRIVLEYLSTKFDRQAVYHENEVNEILKKWHTFYDWPLLRRELVEAGLMKRNLSGTEYKIT